MVALYEIIDDPNKSKLYLVTELVKGGSLMEKINNLKKRLTEEDIRLYFRDLILALEYCHECA